MGTVRIGISGWSYDAWHGDFYPEDLPKSRQLDYASRRFASLEVNGSFYGLIQPGTWRDWRDRTPRGFIFAVKGSRFITHNKKLSNVETPLANFFASGLLLLRQKLGPVLWQLPPHLGFDADRVEGFFELLPKDAEAAADLAGRHDDRVEGRAGFAIEENHRLRHALEVRRESWLCPELVRIARNHGVALVFADSGEWPWTEELTAGFAYLRLHGSPDTYSSDYDDARLDRYAERIRAWAAGGEPEDPDRITAREPPGRKTRDVYVYFDNDARGRAPWNALALAERLGVEWDAQHAG